VEAVGSAEAVQAAITFINVNNLSVEVLGHVPANLRAVG
jgi:D-methionine transport system ATP-binding protein